MYYRRVEIINDETTEPVHFVGFHPLTWMKGDREMIEPTVAFVESDEVEKLFRKIRLELISMTSMGFGRALINEIDALLGDEANR